MPSGKLREDLEAAAPDGMWIDVMDVRPGMRIAHYAHPADGTRTPAVSLVAAMSADLTHGGWEVAMNLEEHGEATAREGAAVRRATVQPDEPTGVGAVVELDTWADSARYVFNGCGAWHDAGGQAHDWAAVCQRGQVHVVVPGMYAIQEAR